MTSNSDDLIVGIGASAGGFEAFKTFFEAMPSDSGLAFVLVQHLAADKKSLLVDLLQRHTQMTVVEAEDDMTIEPNRVHVIPPDATLTVKDGRLHVERPAPDRIRRWPVNSLLISLAKDQGERAVCIILSGGGSDGTIGLKAIKEGGGFTLAQAEHDSEAMQGMPQSASATGLVDVIMPVEDMPTRLMEYQEHLKNVQQRKASDGTREDVEHYIPQICMLVQKGTGHDFSQYKTKTLARRIQRRMQLVQIDDVPDYIKLLRKDGLECQLLFRDLLINVTQFFRDGKPFEALAEHVIPTLIEHTPLDQTIRIWVPGCATGEEAYSVAILLKEAMSRLETTRKVQIFATDLDEEAVRVARAARFRSTISTDVSQERLERWFVQDGDAWCPQRSIREMCIFSVHNILKDPAFSKLDLISCRNLFIYLNSALQVRLLEAFHYSLGAGGFLFLGTSEGVTQQMKLFDIVDKQHRIFQRKDVSASLPPFPLTSRQSRSKTAGSLRPQLHDRLGQQVLAQIAPACVVINQNDEVVRYLGQTGRFIEPSPGVASLNLFTVLRPELRVPARALLQRVREQGHRQSQPHLSIPVNGWQQLITLIGAPVADAETGSGTTVIAFYEEGPPVETQTKGTEHAEDAAEQEVRALRVQLGSVSADLEAANEELKSSHEEYQSVNEELQSTNEELETAKEELQSSNEELQTVNSELTIKNEDLGRAISDLSNFFSSTDIASLFLDGQLRIRTFTPALIELINVRDADRGRPISDLTGQIVYSDMVADVKKVIRTLSMIEREIRAKDGTTFMMRIRPYRTSDNVIDGVVLTFVDITGGRRAGAALKELEKILEDGFNEVYIMDAETFRFVVVNKGARDRLGYSMDELRRFALPDIEVALSLDAFKERISPVVSGEQDSVSYTASHRSKNGVQYPVAVRMSRIVDPPLIIANAIEAKTANA